MAQGIGGELFVVYVDTGSDDDDPERQRSLEANLRFAENLGAQIVQMKGKECGRHVGRICAREAHYASYLRALGHQRIAEVPVSVGSPSISAATLPPWTFTS